MAGIIIRVGDISGYESGDSITIDGEARCTDMEQNDNSIGWSVVVAPDALAATINQAIKDAAVSEAGDRGFTIGALDKKTILGGAVGL